MAQYDPPPATPGGATLHSYDRDRKPTRITRPDRQALEFGYDAAGRLATLTTPDGTTTYGYSAATGQLTRITGPDGGSLDFTYSGALLTQVQWSGPLGSAAPTTSAGTVGYAYDNDFCIREITVDGADPIAYGYDADGLLVSAGPLSLTRDPGNGFLNGTSLSSGDHTTTDSFAYDGFGDVAKYSARFDLTELFTVDSSYDALGRLTRKVEAVHGVVNTFDYGYDLVGRLTEVKQNGATTASYGYDDNGNRTALNGTTIAAYDAQDRLKTYLGTSYEYTANGELESKTVAGATTRYRYDVLGNLHHVDLPGGAALAYLIDGQNRRIGKKVDGIPVQGFLYQDGLRIIAELDAGNQVVSRFVYADKGNVPAYLVKGGTTFRIISDHLGSPRLVVNTSDGVVAQRIDYDEWGRVILDTNPGLQPFGYAGGLYDRDTGLVRFGARDYDPATGRWTAKDPIRFAGGDTNLYGYVLNDPVNWVDPDGLRRLTIPPAVKKFWNDLNFDGPSPGLSYGKAVQLLFCKRS